MTAKWNATKASLRENNKDLKTAIIKRKTPEG